MEVRLTFRELGCKEVVNVRDGKRLGHIIDIVFDLRGRIEGIVTPGFRKFFFFKAVDDIFIPWCDIKKIGEDCILVELKPSTECRAEIPICNKGEDCHDERPRSRGPRICDLLKCIRPRDCRDCHRRDNCPDRAD